MHHPDDRRSALLLPWLFLTIVSISVNVAKSETSIPIATDYRAFGPLPVGAKGIDPLGVLGDDTFEVLRQLETFPSECAYGGVARWVSTAYNVTADTGVISANFSGLQQPGMQYATYFRANMTYSGEVDQYVLLQCSSYAVFKGDDDKRTYCSPDVYGDGRGLCPLTLRAGASYEILVHVYASHNESAFVCNHFFDPSVTRSSFLLPLNDTVTPSVVVDGDTAVLAGEHASFAVQNIHPDAWATAGRARLVAAPVGLQLRNASTGSAVSEVSLPTLTPSQIGVLRFDFAIGSRKPFRVSNASAETVELKIELRYSLLSNGIDDGESALNVTLSLPIMRWGTDTSYRYSFVDVDDSVQMTAVILPRRPCSKLDAARCTVLLSTHGAGVDAVGRVWVESYRVQDGSFVLLPTGRRKYGMNWEGPQLMSAVTSYYRFVNKLPGVPLKMHDDYAVFNNTFLAAGHSQGGHGCLLLSTHFPDLLLGSLPAMGWLRLQSYDSELTDADDNWSYSDAVLRGLLGVPLDQYAADLHHENVLGIPFLARVGSDDDNVPPSNLRKFHRLLKQNEWFHNVSDDQSVVAISEIAGEGHWFDGVVDDDTLQPFLDRHLATGEKPPLPQRFSVFTLNPSSTGSRGGLRIVQPIVYFERSRLTVQRHADGTWAVTTENVHRLSYAAVTGLSDVPRALVVDGGSSLSVSGSETEMSEFCLGAMGKWTACRREIQWDEKGVHSSGSAVEVLLRRRIRVIYPTSDEFLRGFATRWANSMYVRGIAVEIVGDDDEDALRHSGDFNVVLLGGPSTNQATAAFVRDDAFRADVRLRADSDTFCVAGACYSYGEEDRNEGYGIFFVAAGRNGEVIGVTTGTTTSALRRALDWIPGSTFSRAPEWILVGPRYGDIGLGAIIGAGYWDARWRTDARRTYPAAGPVVGRAGVTVDTGWDYMYYWVWGNGGGNAYGMVATAVVVMLVVGAAGAGLWWIRGRKSGVGYERVAVTASTG